jgi:hypothetical protein
MRFEEKSISASVFKRRQAKLETEIAAARDSLAETEQRLTIDAQHLRMALELELADNVAEVYVAADEPTKRGYNQAFFKKLYVVPEWDEDEGQTIVRITGAELTEPYALLLADNLAEDVLSEAEAIAQRASESQSGSPKPFVAVDGSYFVKMAGRSGRPANPVPNLDCLLELLMEPVGRRARRRAAEAIRGATSGV